MDPVARRLARQKWAFADQDPAALAEIGRRVAETGRRRTLITYSDLVNGIDFRLATVNHGRPFRLGIPEWTDLHRRIIGDFLGRLCVDTYLQGKFMGSALVVAEDTRQPSEGYRKLMRELGVLRGYTDEAFYSHWLDQVQRAYAWYGRQESEKGTSLNPSDPVPLASPTVKDQVPDSENSGGSAAQRTWRPWPPGSVVRHRTLRYIGQIDATPTTHLESVFTGPCRNPDESQYRILIKGEDERRTAAECELELLGIIPHPATESGVLKETYCWRCKEFTINYVSGVRHERPSGCGWVICPECRACGCGYM